jgi:dTMP kinase
VRRRGGGRFVVLEGLDGAGTTTQAERLGAWLRQKGRRVHVTGEPSRGPLGALIRQVLSRRLGGGEGRAFDASALALLFAADRLDHVASEIEPKLVRGVDTVCDRYALSSLAYQSVATGEPRWVEQINSWALRPDVTIFLDVRPAVALARRRAVSLDLEIYEALRFQRLVLKSYRKAIAGLRRSGQRLEVLDGERPVDVVAADVARIVRQLL